MQIQPIVVGTAGHIDHGKSTLVQLLTGVDPDRLQEEKDRGMTIDLGFARFDLPDGRRIGIVDVPGHERLVRNMVAGATGIDMVMLVVAADDGVMMQTQEHLAILQLLGVERGFVVLTKIDLVDDEMLELAQMDVEEAVEGTFLEGAPILPYSALTKSGFDELKQVLVELAGQVQPRSTEGIFRMPVQRVFSARGFGTIVTGIPVAGSLSVGDVVEVLPGGSKGKVRGIQAYHEKVDRAQAGHSTAINISDVDHHAVSRGMVVAKPGFFGAISLVGARLRTLKSLPLPIRNRLPIRLHTGTAEVLGEVILLDHEVMGGKQEGLVQLRLSEPVVCAPGDRFILRLASPLLTLGGGVILEESRYRLKRFKGFILEGLNKREASLQTVEDLLESVLSQAPDGWLTEPEVARGLKRDQGEVRSLLSAMGEGGSAVQLAGGHWIHGDVLQNYCVEVKRKLAEWFGGNAHRARMDIRDLRSRVGLDKGLLGAILDRLVETGEVGLESGGFLTLVGHEPRLDDALGGFAKKVQGIYAEGQFQPPSQGEAAGACGLKGPGLTKVFEYLTDAKLLHHVGQDLYLDRACMERMRQEVVRSCRENGELQIADLRDALGTTRKFLIPILEALDAEGLTQRKGGARTLKG
ncbi:MAG: selenocysteine-specific translation elongation factor [bacterium]|nr:selenocysteine-specific translation elongation factor [bacterium]